MQTLEHEKYLALRTGAEVVEVDQFGEKVLRLKDGSYFKLFRRKRLLSSAAWYPYARRFADNARALDALGIPCPQIIGVYRLPEIARDAVHYHPLAGRTIRQRIEASLTPESADRLREDIGAFIARLHCVGAYFRSLHLGNIVQTPEGTLGLIDIADLTTHGKPLGRMRRRRNLKHLTRYQRDAAWLLAGDAFRRGYDAVTCPA